MGLDTDVFRTVSAVLLIGVGVLLLVSRLQEQFAVAAGPVSGQWAGGYLDNFAATRASPDNSVSGCCSERCGVHALGRRLARPLCLPPRARVSARWL
jgi:hypothetical protein